ncbi:MAG: hypothetical protein KME13_11855 [Myxacorys californica WJT36-NPBG1]|jgi:hypothetical protein|nr:hypothetical protein [Myxacorys californica WJT36-NPBG1]
MALAILRFQDSDGGKSRFQIDLGTNRFYTYAIASNQMHQNGLTLLEDPTYISPVIGPLPESSLGRTILEVPNHKFDRQHRLIQITSFRTADRVGPAYSEAIQVVSISPEALPAKLLPTKPLPVFSRAKAMDKPPVEIVPFQYREVQPMSDAMFLGGLMNVFKNVAGSVVGAVAKVAPTVLGAIAGGGAPGAGGGAGGGIAGLLGSVLPQLAGVIGGLMPQLTPGSAEGGAAPGQPDASQITALLAALLQQIGTAVPGQTPAGSMTPVSGTAPARPQPIMNHAPVSSRRSAVQAQSMALSVQNYYSDRPYQSTAYGFSAPSEEEDADPYSEGKSYDYASEYAGSLSADYADALEYSESMFLPMLGGLLSSLLPSLLPAIPSLLSSLGPQLMNIFGSLFGGQKTAGQMSLMLGVDEAEADDHGVLMALSLAIAAAPTPDIVFQRVSAVTLEFTDLSPVMMHGKSRFLYRHDRDISFSLKLETPQPVRKAKLQLLVKDPKTLKVLIEQNYPIESATTGTLTVVPKISKEQLKALTVNEEYLVCVNLVWQGRSKKTGEIKQLGTSTLKLMTLVGEYLFDRVEGTSETIALNDVDRHRPYWHKVWQGDFTDDLRRINFECKYYYSLENNRTENARMETVTQVLEDDLAGRKSRLKSGLMVSPYGLNELLGRLGKHPQLSEAELAALMSSEFKGRFSHAARTEVKFSGKPRQTVALWVYPEFKLQQVFLKQVEQTNGNGHVLSLKEHPVYFPMPAVAHFIGVST